MQPLHTQKSRNVTVVTVVTVATVVTELTVVRKIMQPLHKKNHATSGEKNL